MLLLLMMMMLNVVEADAVETNSVHWRQVELLCLAVSATCSSKHQQQYQIKQHTDFLDNLIF